MIKQNSKETLGRPDWAERTIALRRTLGLSQTAFGARLGVSFMTVSRWERGVKEPYSNDYIQLGNLDKRDPWYFWSRAGLSRGMVIDTLPAAVRRRVQLEHVPECPHKEGYIGDAGCVCVVVNRMRFEQIVARQGTKAIQAALAVAAREMLDRQR